MFDNIDIRNINENEAEQVVGGMGPNVHHDKDGDFVPGLGHMDFAKAPHTKAPHTKAPHTKAPHTKAPEGRRGEKGGDSPSYYPPLGR